jgi:MoxR-like ATPase
VRDYIVRLVGATRGHGAGGKAAMPIAQAASPRASINLALAACAIAWLDDRDHVTPDDISALAPDILCGRITLDYRSRASGITARQVVHEVLDATPRV